MFHAAATNIPRLLPGALAVLIGIAGWFYLFYSRAASNLVGIENQKLNSRRSHLRRVGAIVMLGLASLIVIGAYGFDMEHPTATFFIIWLAVLLLLFIMVILGLVDVRLTYKLRHTFRERRSPTTKPPAILLWLVIGACGFANGCADSSSTALLPTTNIQLGNKTFVLEIAHTASARERGLMKRDSIPSDHGMIFVFPDQQPLSFWMKNTRIPLDIIYIDGAGKVVAVKRMKPYALTPVPSPRPAKWAIELNEGAAQSAGVKVGDVIEIPPAAKDAH